MFQIFYEKHETGNFYVTLLCISQTIVLRPGFFRKIVGINKKTVAGCCEITAEQLCELGFVIPSFWTTSVWAREIV